jgi:DNA-binding NarL/FixJ family response regulator
MTERQAILVVEDNPAIARLVREYLRDCADLAVDSVGSLAEALAYLRREAVALVLLDLGLPDAYGLQALTGLRAAFPAARVIIFTGNDDETLAARARELGAIGYLPKTELDAETLLLFVRQVLAFQPG